MPSEPERNPKSQPTKDETSSPSNAIDSGDPPPIDWEHADTTVGGDRELLSELMNVYTGEVNNLMQQISTAVASDDRELLRRAAHTVKGASLSIGAIPASTVAQQLEGTAESGDIALIKEYVLSLEESLSRVIASIQQYLASQP